MKAPLSTLGVKQEMLIYWKWVELFCVCMCVCENYEAVIVSTGKRPKEYKTVCFMVFSMNHSSKLIKCGLCSRLYNRFLNPRLVIALLPN